MDNDANKHSNNLENVGVSAESKVNKKKLLTYAGIGAFAFFLVKGLAWLIVPAVLVWYGTH